MIENGTVCQNTKRLIILPHRRRVLVHQSQATVEYDIETLSAISPSNLYQADNLRVVVSIHSSIGILLLDNPISATSICINID